MVLTFTLVLCIAATIANLPPTIYPQLIVMHKDSHMAMNPKEVSRIIINSSLGFITNYHALLTSLHSNWKIVNWHLGKCADERDI